MSKKKTKKKKKSSLIKQLSIIIGIVAVVIVVAIVVVNAINKTTIKTITVEGAYQELYIGNPEFGSVEVGISVYPETASKSSLMAFSANPEIATVNFDGEKLTVEAVGVGTTTVTVRHANKSSLYDTMQITVKDVDVQGLTFVQPDAEGVLNPVTKVDIKKDGFKHYIPFNLDPIDANMNNLKIEEFNTAVFESVEIDQITRSLVVVPKTDIVQTSAEIDVDIYQNTTEGFSAVQVASLQVNLLNREAHIRFNLSSDPSRGYSLLDYTGNNSSNQNIVYLEQSNNASDVYVLPEIGYDVNFASVGSFSLADYDLYFDGTKVNDNNFNSNNEFSYRSKLLVSKSRGNFYYFKALSDFEEGDCIYVKFVHKYTGASSGLQFIYLDVQSIGLDSNQPFSISTGSELNLGEVVSLNFSYDTGVDKGVVEIYTFEFQNINGKTTRVETSIFGDDENSETISVKKDNKKLSLWTKGLTDGTTINFGVRCNYWDTRYVRINEEYYLPVNFTVSSVVNGLHVEQLGAEINVLNLTKGTSAEISLVAEPEGGDVEASAVTKSVTTSGGNPSDIEISWVEGNIFEIRASANASVGTYTIKFEYKGNETTLFVVV